MRIAMIGHKRIPSRIGGVEVVVQQLSEGLVKIGDKVTAFNRASRYSNKIKSYHGVSIRTVPTLKLKGLSAASSSLFATIIASISNFDVIHIHAEGPAVMCWIPHFFGKKCVVTIHGLDYKRDKWGKLARNYIQLGEKMAVKYADQIIVLNKPMQNYFWKKYRKKTILIPNGIDEAYQAKADKIRLLGLKKGFLYFVFRTYCSRKRD